MRLSNKYDFPKTRIMQGDQYPIPFCLEDANGTDILPDQVESIEIVIGTLKKLYPNEIEYEDGQYLFPITQQESFAMKDNVPVQVRIKFLNGNVAGTSIRIANILESVSKEVL